MIINQEIVAAALRECADYIKEHAEDIVGDEWKATTNLTLHIEFDFPIEHAPIIKIEREICAIEAAKVLIYGETKKP